MQHELYVKSLRDQRRSLSGWSLALIAFSVFMMAMYPTVKDTAKQLDDYIRQMPETLKSLFGGLNDYATMTGYLKAEMFNFMVPVLFLIFAIGSGGRAIAGEEERGTLELLMGNPVSRRRVVVQKLGALLTSIAVLTALLWSGVAIGAVAIGASLSLIHLTAQATSLALLSVAFGSMAFATGAFFGRKAVASATCAGLAVAGYLVNALSSSVGWLRPYRLLSPFYYYGAHDPILHGLDPLHVAVLAGISILFAAAALVGFERRDLAV
jgi:ABC-2 type transport system permease protein